MNDEAQDQLRSLEEFLAESVEELKGAVGNFERLLKQLGTLQRAIEAGELDLDTLKATETVFYHFPQLEELRAGVRTHDGLESTRELRKEIQNRIVAFEKKQG